jgi:ribonuclease III
MRKNDKLPEIDFSPLEELLGYHFENKALLRQAFTLAHGKKSATYERLEFLGDRVVGLIVASLLYLHFSNEDEGDLAKRFTALVREEALAQLALDLKLDALLITNEEELRHNPSILSDVFEALMGALFLEKGLDFSRSLVAHLWMPYLLLDKKPPVDNKTRLQETVQKKGLPLPKYVFINKEGAEHAPVFLMEVDIEGYPPVTGKGASKRLAEQQAAATFLKTYFHEQN